MVISDEQKLRISIGSDLGIERLISYVDRKERAAKDQQRQEFVNSREYCKYMKMIEEGIMERKPYQNQFGAAVPTEYSAIRNITKRPETQVARYDKPNLDERQRAVDVYDEALNAGMDEADAIEMVKVTTGMADEWLKCVPDWWKSVKDYKKEEKGKIYHRYSNAEKKKWMNVFCAYRDAGISTQDAMAKANKDTGLIISEKVLYKTLPKDKKLRNKYSKATKRKALDHFEELKAQGMPAADAAKKTMDDLKLTAHHTSIYEWRRELGVAKQEKKEEPKPEVKQEVKQDTVKCECGREVPAEYAFCPYCGKKLETEKEKLVRYCKEVIAAFDGAEFSATEMKAKIMSIEMFIEREVS